MKKLAIIGGAIVVVFIALVLINNIGQDQQLANNDQYDTDDLQQATIDQLDDPNYQNIIMPDELEEKLANGESATVYFFSPVCEFCRAATPELMEVAEEEDVHIDQYNVYEYDDGPHNITHTPTIIHFEDGEEVQREDGNLGKEGYRQFLQNVVNQ
ncbi:thioredoxin family protein [Shouchella shacheensis]|uniref:thioredoxin family protein n=1 Tax=Shouchella shacheensis TaxID=1649580 RepID=UPI0007401015|nr:thioredoxin family protein [Shouchella shacheensis]